MPGFHEKLNSLRYTTKSLAEDISGSLVTTVYCGYGKLPYGWKQLVGCLRYGVQRDRPLVCFYGSAV